MVNIEQSLKDEASLPHKHFSWQGREIYIYREISSTNSIAQDLALSGTPQGTIVLARSQTSGRGRMKRQWACPPGQGILMSMVLRPKISIQLIPQLALLSGVAVAEAIRQVTGCAAGIKWPNDVIIGGKKVCGILAQSSFCRGNPEYVIIGVGINVNLDTNQLPPDCRETSTSLRQEMGHNVSRAKVLEKLIISWEKHYQGLLKGGNTYLRSKWIESNVTLGRSITLNKDDYPILGEAVDISERGGIIVKLDDGSLKEFLAADLSLGRSHYVSMIN